MKQVKNEDEHKNGWKIGYEDGYLKGLWASCQKNDECGRCLNTAKPYWKLIPDYGVVDLVRIGLEKKKEMLVRLWDAQNIENEIMESVAKRQGLSMLMIAEEEIKVLAEGAGLVMPTIKLKEINLTPVINTKLVASPQMCSLLVKSIEQAEIIGIPGIAVPNYLPLLTDVLKRFGIDLARKKLTSNTIAYQGLKTGFLGRVLLNGRPGVVIVSSQAREFQNRLTNEGVNVLDVVTIPDRETFTENTIAEITEYVCSLSPQIVLLSLPVLGPILTTAIGTRCPLIAWDIGHLSPHILGGLSTAEGEE